MKSFFWILVLWVVWVSPVWACPSCVSTGNQKYFVQTFIALTAMFFIPLVAVGVVVWRIRKMGGFKDDDAQGSAQ